MPSIATLTHASLPAAPPPAIAPPDLLTIDRLRLSPFNVRTNEDDATDTGSLELSILALGLINPLRVHPMRGNGTKGRKGDLFGVHAGGRRYRSIRALIERGELPEDWAIPVRISTGLSDAELVEESIAENGPRRDLRPYEEYAGVARAHRMGDTVDKIADRVGQDAAWVRQAIRLGNLAPPIFKALSEERISVDQAKAYGATEDHALQLAAFEDLERLDEWQKTPAKIRTRLGFNDAELGRLLRFVGDEAYRAMGGQFEFDLFADDAEQRGRVMDEPLLRTMVDTMLAGLRDDLRVRSQLRDLRFVASPPENEFRQTDWSLQVTPKEEGDRLDLPEGAIVACIQIPESGKPNVTWWWESRKAKFGREKEPPRPAPKKVAAGAALANHHDDAKRQADAAIREEAGASADTVQIFRSLRQAMLRAMLVDDADTGGDLGGDYLVFAQIRLALGPSRAADLGMRAIREESTTGVGDGLSKARPHVDAAPAAEIWGRAIAGLVARPFMVERDPVVAFRHYRAETPAMRRRAAAVVAGLALERSLNADGYRVALHDAIGAALGDDLRRYWSPTAELLDLLPTKERLAIVEPMVEGVALAPQSRAKSADLTRFVLEVVKGAGDSVRRTMRDAAKAWIHPLLQFPGDATPAPASAAEKAA